MIRHALRTFLCGLVVLAFAASPRPAPAADVVRKDLAEMAREVAKFLGKQGENSVAVGQFVGPANFPASAGPGIALMLTEELEKLGIKVKLRARLGIRGQYQLAEIPTADDPNSAVVAVRLKATMEDAFGAPQNFAFERVCGGEETLVELFGAAVAIPSKALPRDRDRQIRKSLKEPHASLADARIKAADESPYAIEVLVDGKPRAGRDDEGLAFVDLDKSAPFAIRLINDSDKEAAVRLTVDGLNVFAFTEHREERGPRKGDPRYSVLLVPAKGSLVVKGWHRTHEKADPFRVLEYAGAADLGKHRGKLGTITAIFSAAWDENAEPPADEVPSKRGTTLPIETGPGDPATLSAVRRKVGALRSAVSVRYPR